MRFSALQRAENSSIPAHKSSATPTPFVSVLFSEPKIPQSNCRNHCSKRDRCFSALQRAENSSIVHLQFVEQPVQRVSVLFSEPKIPQSEPTQSARRRRLRFSALQRAENSSIQALSIGPRPPGAPFQCSSASRKFLNANRAGAPEPQDRVSVLFSEPKIPQWIKPDQPQPGAVKFQCSSASRKFLNKRFVCGDEIKFVGFSALQRAENSSIQTRNRLDIAAHRVSVLFSEPKIPQL